MVREATSAAGGASAATDVPGTKRHVIRGTSLNLAGTALTMLVGFFTTPFFVHHLGSAAYGIYSLVLVFTLTGYFGYLDFGFGSAAVYRASTAAAHARWDDVTDVISSAVAMLAVLGVLFAAVVVALASTLGRTVFSVPEALRGGFTLGLYVAGAALLLQFPALGFAAALQSVQRWDIVVALRIAATLVGVGCAAFAVAVTDDIRGLILPVVMAPAAAALAVIVLARRVVPRLRPSPRRTRRSEISALFRYGWLAFVAQLGVAVVGNLDQPLIAGFLNARVLGQYAVAATLYYAVFGIVAITNSTVFAATTLFTSLGDRARAQELTLRATRYGATLTLVAAVTMAIFGPRFIVAWVGPGFRPAGAMLLIWLSHFALTAFTGVPQAVLAAVGRVAVTAVAAVISVAVNVAVSLSLVGPLGARGVILGTVAAYCVSGPILVVLGLRATGVHARAFVTRTFLPGVAPAIAAGCVGLGLRAGLDPRSLPSLLALAAATSLVGLSVWAGIMRPTERADFRSALARAPSR